MELKLRKKKKLGRRKLFIAKESCNSGTVTVCGDDCAPAHAQEGHHHMQANQDDQRALPGRSLGEDTIRIIEVSIFDFEFHIFWLVHVEAIFL